MSEMTPELSNAEIDILLERYDRTDQDLQRRIVAAFVSRCIAAEAEVERLKAGISVGIAVAQSPCRECDRLRTALAASEQEVEQYRQVIQAGRRLPDPDLSQDPAYAAFVLGKLEQARAELVAAAAPLHAFIRAANIGNNNEPIVLVELDRLPQPYELTLGQLRGLAALLARHAPETPK